MAKNLSVFIDESGDFGEFDPHSPFYIVSMVLHDQSEDISDYLSNFCHHISELGFSNHAIHTAPLIRKDVSEYENLSREERRKLFNSLFHLARRLPIRFLSVTVSKITSTDEIELTYRITKELKKTLTAKNNYFSDFDKIIVYYDNGQVQLTKIITAIFSVLFENVEMRKVRPVDYTLFQVADLICTVELAEAKSRSCGLSKSENDFYMGVQSFRKNIYKHIQKKLL